MNKCEFCNRELSSVNSLKNHQKTAKFCLEKQREKKIISKVVSHKCLLCDREFTLKQALNRHELVCKSKDNLNDMKEEINNLKQKLIFKEETISELKEIISKHEETISKLQESLTRIAEKPTNVTNNNTSSKTTNNVNMLNVLNLTPETIEQKVNQYYTETHLLDGQPGLARFCNDHVIRDDTGKSMITISDGSRGILKYKDPNGAVITDYKGAKFINMINTPVQNKSKQLFLEIGNRFYAMASEKDTTDDQVEIERIRSEQAINGFQSIREVGSNATDFLKELIRIM